MRLPCFTHQFFLALPGAKRAATALSHALIHFTRHTMLRLGKFFLQTHAPGTLTSLLNCPGTHHISHSNGAA